MGKLIFLLPLLLIGCSTVDKAVNELPLELKQGCYYKAVVGQGSIIDAAGSYAKDAIFCTSELPETYCYQTDNGRTQVSVGNCK